MNNFLSQILSTIGNTAQGFNDYMTAPGNPYDVKSPIPNDQLVTRNLPTGVQSPIPQDRIIQHVQGGSGFQDTMNQFKPYMQKASDNLRQWNDLINQPNKQKTLAIPQPTTQPVSQPVVRPAPASNTFRDFTTAPVPSTHSALIEQSAKEAGINPNLLASLLFTEHGFSLTPGWNKSIIYDQNGNYVATSWDRGPAQINTYWHPNITDAQALDPNFAIPWAAQKLASDAKIYGLPRAILAYNHGGNGQKDIVNPATDIYYKKVVNGLTPTLRRSLGL